MDRTTRGLLAGITASVPMNLWNLIDYYYLEITQIRFIDWASVLLTLDRPNNIITTIFALLMQMIVWNGFLGAVFAHLVPITTSKGLICKSTLYSLVLWFFFKVIVNLYRIPFVSGLQPYQGALSNVFAVIIWGIALGIVLKRIQPADSV